MSAFSPRELGGRLRLRKGLVWPLFALLVVGLVGFKGCLVYVEPGQMGVKQVIVGLGKGIHDEIYGPGWHTLTPGAERMHLFRTDLQVLEMTDRPEAKLERSVRRVPAIKIQTSEGYTVSVDVTVLYRIENPFLVMTQIGPGKIYEDSAVIPRAEQQLRRRLGELDAEEFYAGDTREKAATETQKLLMAELLPKGIRVDHVLVRQYRYDKRYQQAIEQRKIQDQTVFKNQAEAAAAQEEAKRNRIVAEGQAAVEVELARGAAEVQKLASEAELYRRMKAAEGELKVKLATAQGTELSSKALRGAGSDKMVGLKMADVLKGTEVMVIPTDGESGINPLDLSNSLRRFDVRGE